MSEKELTLNKSKHVKKVEGPYTGTPEDVIKGLKFLLRKNVYEDEDYHISEHSVSIDLIYNSKGDVEFYIEQLKKKFPGMVTVSHGNHITIHYPKGSSYVNNQGQ